MFHLLKKTDTWLEETEFLIKSAFGVSVVSFVILAPFCVNNFMHGRVFDGLVVMLIAILCIVNAWLSWRGKYLLSLNLFAIMPAITAGCVNVLLTLGVVGSYWAYLGVVSIYFILPLRIAKYVNSFFLVSVIFAAWHSLTPDVYIRFAAVLTGMSFFIFLSNREISNAQKILRKQSVTDTLTGVFNRLPLTKMLNKAIQKFERSGTKATLCVVDIDHFKKINDAYGHDVGDEVLKEIAIFMSTMIGKKDTIFRIGGEEFLILMRNTDAFEGSKTADALRATVEDLNIIENHPITISIGVTEIEAGFGWKEWMKRSDEKLYTAKKNGRNQVVI